ncbi:aspartyl-phosphate phosphatase Spo0E family protein [Romboutsia sp. MSSM.1001216sp_RTP31141st1_G3_RTP31141_220114]|uniref:aspartyl-phosphate phosphatase Spo0E family protein n=1 Tax=unclassified Romboutsia TaxID=2626894 RepID=UPI0031B615ED
MKIKEKIELLKTQLNLICEEHNLLSEEVILISKKLDILIAIEQREKLNKLFNDRRL